VPHSGLYRRCDFRDKAVNLPLPVRRMWKAHEASVVAVQIVTASSFSHLP
jgi:hypothetical protein